MPDKSATNSAPARHLYAALADAADHTQWLSFEQFLSITQHHPLWGYYGSGRVRFGEAGDFYTAPTLSPLFGKTLANFIQPFIADSGGGILELGAGDGALASQILGSWQGGAPPHYNILETSAPLASQQRRRLAGHANVRWLNRLPDNFAGVIIANEVLDSVPFRLYQYQSGSWQERGVQVKGGQLTWQNKPPRDQLHEHLLNLPNLPDGYLTELSPQAVALAAALAHTLKSGVILLADYGSDFTQYYHPQRAMGSLRCYAKQQVDYLPLENIGSKDITAHVDFSAIAHRTVAADCQLLTYTTQTHFLLQAGIEQCLPHPPSPPSAEYFRQVGAVQKLVSPAEMGESIKWLLLGKALLVGWQNYFSLPIGDISHRL